MSRESLYAWLGRAWIRAVRKRQRWAGTYQVAKNLRKQGVGLLTAKLLLLGRV